MNYKEAIKLPKGGAVKMDKNNMLAAASEIIAKKHGINASALYEWAIKFNVDLIHKGYIFSDIKNNSALLGDILNDQYKYTKKL